MTLKINIVYCILITITSSLVANAQISRNDLTNQLKKAESLRASYQATMTETYHYEINGKRDRKWIVERLSAGDGRHQVKQYNGWFPDGKMRVDLGTWSNGESRGLQYFDGDTDSPRSLGIMEMFPGHANLDEMDACFGVLLPLPRNKLFYEKHPSEVLQDDSLEVSTSEVTEHDRSLVEVLMLDPYGPNIPGVKVRMVYDPNRQWLPVEFSYELYSDKTKDKILQKVEWHLISAQMVDEVWMPKEIIRIAKMGEKNESKKSTMLFSKMVLNPPYTDDDFTINVSDLPKNSSIVDSRLKISYKLGQNFIYMNGHLNEVKQPIDHEIKPDELKDLMKDAIPYIDPVAAANEANLKTVTPTGKYTSYTKWGFILLALAFASMGIILWRKNHI